MAEEEKKEELVAPSVSGFYKLVSTQKPWLIVVVVLVLCACLGVAIFTGVTEEITHRWWWERHTAETPPSPSVTAGALPASNQPHDAPTPTAHPQAKSRQESAPVKPQAVESNDSKQKNISQTHTPSIGSVTGDQNVTGNVVTGNQNIVGNNNQLNLGLFPPRHLQQGLISSSLTYLSVSPASVTILYPQGDSEAYSYGSEIAGMLRSAGWKVDGPQGVLFFSHGAPGYGVSIQYRGDMIKPGQPVPVDLNAAWGRLWQVLETMQGGTDLYCNPSPNMPDSNIHIEVHTNPKAKRQ